MITYIYSLIVLTLVLIMQVVGIEKSLYVQYPGYDIIMHILGGAGLGLALTAAVKLHGNTLVHKRSLIIIGTIALGIIWEIFEVYSDIAGHTFGTKLYWIDTVKDLIDDTIGGVIVTWVVFGKKKEI